MIRDGIPKKNLGEFNDSSRIGGPEALVAEALVAEALVAEALVAEALVAVRLINPMVA